VAGMLVLAIADLPYGYYTFLRIVVCVSAGYTAYVAYESKKIPWAWMAIPVCSYSDSGVTRTV